MKTAEAAGKKGGWLSNFILKHQKMSRGTLADHDVDYFTQVLHGHGYALVGILENELNNYVLFSLSQASMPALFKYRARRLSVYGDHGNPVSP